MKQTMETLWDTLGRVVLLDDLDIQQRRLTVTILQCVVDSHRDNKVCLEQWEAANPHFMQRWKRFLADLRSTSELKLMMFFVIVRELVHMVAEVEKPSLKIDMPS
ncbi:NAD-glutamate dehydrogenase domain-containing protein [Rickettsiella massiliensis]|uniref:NAD-glutamate dehydrogenase domain-containing protein n=1 Tax=Rickettsiella massiliensis TaxID=676517 RepID=UPI00031E2952|nr:NAD-glutamate dehydrogenase domain-containing protein [Rickettsiella massiliensis]